MRFKIVGSGSYFVKAANSKAQSTSGTVWKTNLENKVTLSAGTYEWTWDKTIPGTATPGSGQTVRISSFLPQPTHILNVKAVICGIALELRG